MIVEMQAQDLLCTAPFVEGHGADAEALPGLCRGKQGSDELASLGAKIFTAPTCFCPTLIGEVHVFRGGELATRREVPKALALAPGLVSPSPRLSLPPDHRVPVRLGTQRAAGEGAEEVH